MNELLQIIFLSIIQGITEFLPISSSAHLIIFPNIFGWKDQGTFLDISMHFGSLLAVIYYFYKFQKGIFSSSNTSDFISIKKIIIGSLPVLIFGFIFYDYISLNFRSIEIISVSTIFVAILLLASEYFAKNNKEIKNINNLDIFIIGLFQTIALVPGTSRSAIIILAALLLGYNKKSSIIIALTLAFPVIFLAMSHEILMINSHLYDFSILIKSIISILISFLVSFLVIKYFIKLIDITGFYPYMIYRIFLGFFLIIFFL